MSPVSTARFLQASGLQVKADERLLLDGVDLQLQPGQLLGVLGPNGAGKTTLLRALLGVLQPEQGTVTLQEQPLQRWSARERARRMAYLAQGQQVHWPLPVRDVVAPQCVQQLQQPRDGVAAAPAVVSTL